MIFDFIAQEDDISSACRAAGAAETGGSRRMLGRVLWRYFLAVWCLVGMAFGLKAMAIGVFLIWLGHPVLIAMKLSDLARKNRLVSDGARHRWFVSIGGVPQRENIVSLKNVFFRSQDEMRRVLVGFCRVRLLLYVAALLVALHDGHVRLQLLPAGDWTSVALMAMALANAAFFLQRSLLYYRLLRLGQRQAWQVGTARVDSAQVFAAYKPCAGNGRELYVPYLLAILAPQVA